MNMKPTACPGEVISLDVGDSLSVFGTMEGAFNLLDTCYEIEDGAEHTYDITIAQAGTLHLALVDSDSLDGMLVVTPACGDLSLQTCYDASPHGEETAFNVEPGTFSLIVEAMGGTTGDYVLNVTLDTPACGDGIVNGGEACDVGTGIPNDGCGDPGTPAACQIELPPPDVDVCPGEPVSLPEGTTSFFASDGYSTIGFDDSYGGTCRLQEGGHDRVFAMTPAISGTVTALVGYDAARTEPACYADWNSPHCWDQLIYARSSCTSDAPEDEMACADDTGGDGEQITFAVTAGVPFYLFVDGYDYEWFSEGPFNLFVDLTP